MAILESRMVIELYMLGAISLVLYGLPPSKSANFDPPPCCENIRYTLHSDNIYAFGMCIDSHLQELVHLRLLLLLYKV